jgi:hypothetical protein
VRRRGPPAYSCMHMHGSAWRPPAPSQWVRCGPRNLNALDRACMRACMRGGVQQRPAGKEEAHAFARPPTGCKLCALCSRNASSRAESRTVRNGRSRRWGCCRTPRDMGIIAEQVPGPERGYRAACGVQQRSGPATAGRWLSCGWATPCSAGPSLTEEGREGPREIIYEPSSPIAGRQRMPAHLRAELRTVISSIAIVGVENGLPQRNGAPRSASSATRNALQRAGREGASNPRKLPARCRCRCPLPLPAAAAAARGGGRVFPLSRWEGREPGWDGGARRSALGLRAHRGGGWPHAWAPCGSGRPWGHWSAGEQSRAGCVIFA